MYRKSTLLRLMAAVVFSVALAHGRDLHAQVASPCPFSRCGLWMEGRVLLRGTAGDTIARPHWGFDPRLPLTALATDSSRRLAQRFNRDGPRAQVLAALGTVLAIGGVAVAYGHDADLGDLSVVDRGDAAGVWGIRTAIAGLALTGVAHVLWARASVWRDRALGAHNAAISSP